MKRLLTICVATAFVGAVHDDARAEKVFETGTPGAAVDGGDAINSNFYAGVRFTVSGAPTKISTVGGHFDGVIVSGPRTIFGAIIKLVAPSNVPASTDFTSLPAGDVLGTALLTLDAKVPGGLATSKIYEAPLQGGPITLDPGTYGLVFGGGLFGADSGVGVGAVTNNNTTFPQTDFFGVDVDDDLFTENRLDGLYFFATPEPGSATLAGMAFIGLIMMRRRRS